MSEPRAALHVIYDPTGRLQVSRERLPKGCAVALLSGIDLPEHRGDRHELAVKLVDMLLDAMAPAS
jgi:hypothetical protein